MSDAPVLASSVRLWPGMRSEYACVGPHADADVATTVTRPFQIGIAFTGHRQVVYEAAGRRVSTDVAPGSAVITGSVPVTWLRVHEVTEALEIYPDPGLIDAVAGGPVSLEPAIGARDGTVLGIGSVLRRTHSSGWSLSDVAASTLAHRLVGHLLSRYGGLRPPPITGPGLLDAHTVDQVTEFIEAGLGGVLTLDSLASVARLSPFHFARGFCRTTGIPPHQFVTSRRMDRARLLLRASDLSVAGVAGAVGFSNLSHFRRVFRSYHGDAPSALRSGHVPRTARTDLPAG